MSHACYLAPDEGGGRLRRESNVVVELVEGHVLRDVLGERHAVRLRPSGSQRLVFRKVADLVHVALVQEDRTRYLCVRR